MLDDKNAFSDDRLDQMGIERPKPVLTPAAWAVGNVREKRDEFLQTYLEWPRQDLLAPDRFDACFDHASKRLGVDVPRVEDDEAAGAVRFYRPDARRFLPRSGQPQTAGL